MVYTHPGRLEGCKTGDLYPPGEARVGITLNILQGGLYLSSHAPMVGISSLLCHNGRYILPVMPQWWVYTSPCYAQRWVYTSPCYAQRWLFPPFSPYNGGYSLLSLPTAVGYTSCSLLNGGLYLLFLAQRWLFPPPCYAQRWLFPLPVMHNGGLVFPAVHNGGLVFPAVHNGENSDIPVYPRVEQHR